MKVLYTVLTCIFIFGISQAKAKNSLYQPHSRNNYSPVIHNIQESKSTISTKVIVSWLDQVDLTRYEKKFESSTKDKRTAQLVVMAPDYWETLYSIESKQGSQMYRPRNKAKSCKTTTAACGHHQLTSQALKDIGCKSQQCKNDRENFEKSLAMSKSLDIINEKRLAIKGYENLPDYQRYLIHQQGATGIRNILDTLSGKKLLNKKLAKNMANNSPFSYKRLRQLGGKLAAKKFLVYWKSKWQEEQKLVINKRIKQHMDKQANMQVASI